MYESDKLEFESETLNGKWNEQSDGWEKQRFIHLNGKWNEQSDG